ncbi:MAG: pilA, partial [Pseudonocardiales bacterium]|nr:pilA [Pseudonocardiales bacterium]
IELLVVVVIIGILVAIAIPLYLNYRKGAENKSAESDVRNAVATVEQFYADSNKYPATVALTTGNVTFVAATVGDDPLTATVGDGNKLKYTLTGIGSVATYEICATHDTNNKMYTYSSTTGKIAEAAGGCA